VLHYRVNQAIEAYEDQTSRKDDPAIGIVTRATRPGNDDTAQALAEREVAMAARADVLVESALAGRMAWVHQLGRPPSRPDERLAWLRHAATVAAYRDRWSIESATRPVGDPTTPMGAEQTRHLRMAVAAARRARSLSWERQGGVPKRHELSAAATPEQPGEGIDL